MGLPRPEQGIEESVVRARESYERRAWRDARERLSRTDPGVLEVEDLERLAVAAYLTGDDERSDDAWIRAHQRSLEAGDPARAAHAAFWLGLNLLLRGDMARSGGWLGRARTLLDDCGDPCVVEGLLLIVDAMEQLERGDARSAGATFERAGVIGTRFADRDLITFGLLGRGEALVAQGELARGVAYLDEAMVAVVADEVSPPVAGIVYCAVLLQCRDTFDARRAREWTEALTRWCDAQPDLVPYRGQCMVHRSEVLQLQGKWSAALEEARRACVHLAGHPAIGEAYYQQAQMHRLRGDYGAAEAAYRRANEFGREPQPGLALLRLAQGDVAAALASVRRVAAEAEGRTARSRVLSALVEICLAAGERGAAQRAADELGEIAATVDTPLLDALAAHARGSVLLARGEPRQALLLLRTAQTVWHDLGAPYELARERGLIAIACRELGDEEAARLDGDAARTMFEALGAVPDAAAVADLGGGPPADGLPAGLTPRQLEVLRLVAAGKSNHDIAIELVVSDHTVRRHLQNIFAKAGVSSRAAATAYAFEHGLT
jgi:DNA-binding CsgD family transcriptional regulator